MNQGSLGEGKLRDEKRLPAEGLLLYVSGRARDVPVRVGAHARDVLALVVEVVLDCRLPRRRDDSVTHVARGALRLIAKHPERDCDREKRDPGRKEHGTESAAEKCAVSLTSGL